MITMLIIAGVALSASSLPPQANRQSRVQLELELVDGTLLQGQPAESTMNLRLRTHLGRATVSLKQLQRFEVQGKGETIVLRWSNKDRLAASPEFKDFSLQTVIGNLNVPLKVVRRGRILLIEPPKPLKPVSIKTSGSYAHQTADKAFDGSLGSAWSSGDWKGWIEFDLGESIELGEIRFWLQFSPSGKATHEVYVSDHPIGVSRKNALLLQKFSGQRTDHDRLTIDCATNVSARYVQICCPSSRSWFNIRELELYPR